jgi:hypothetical protein
MKHLHTLVAFVLMTALAAICYAAPVQHEAPQEGVAPPADLGLQTAADLNIAADSLAIESPSYGVDLPLLLGLNSLGVSEPAHRESLGLSAELQNCNSNNSRQNQEYRATRTFDHFKWTIASTRTSSAEH